MESLRNHSSHSLHSVAKETTRSQDNRRKNKTNLCVLPLQQHKYKVCSVETKLQCLILFEYIIVDFFNI